MGNYNIDQFNCNKYMNLWLNFGEILVYEQFQCELSFFQNLSELNQLIPDRHQ